MSSKWTKVEDEIFKENFVTTKWEELLKIPPNKTEKQILSRAKKFGLKRESEYLGYHYDSEKHAWWKHIKPTDLTK
ncbi:hypothetical protein [Metabacillus litoralis]|jgi:hypothetical protein|uniref:hypothetical protein n=1 Tax=Metabacillus litoralis TaxID=152268 RepID=UPI002040E818|nr:hypothetical protein [Metabacillus litoralis]MCM3654318.1 hypothetical protein [Metabacillus litoralis]